MKHSLSLLCIVIGVALVWVGVVDATSRAVSVAQDIPLDSNSVEKSRNLDHQPVQILIGSNNSLPISQESYQDGVWSVSETTASHLSTSGFPHEKDNIIIYGHNRKHVFGSLHLVTLDTPITLTLADGTERDYQITSAQQVTTDRIDLLQSTGNEVLTVYTCAGLFDQDRFVVQAIPVDAKIERNDTDVVESEDTWVEEQSAAQFTLAEPWRSLIDGM